MLIDYFDIPITVSKLVSSAVYYPIDSACPADYEDYDIVLDYYELEVDDEDVADVITDYLYEKREYGDKEPEDIYDMVLADIEQYYERYENIVKNYFLDRAKTEAENEYEYEEPEPDYYYDEY